MKTFLSSFLWLCICLTGWIQADIVEAEYFINSDPGQGNGTAITITGDGNSLDIEVDPPIIAALPFGFHVLAVRVMNDQGLWSNSEIRSFAKLDPAQNVENFPAASTIVAAEYFINADPGQGNGTAISISGNGTSLDVSVNSAQIAALEDGFHVLAVRVKNALGHWSDAEFRSFSKTQPDIAEPRVQPLIAALEYQWFQNNIAVTAPITVNASPQAIRYTFTELASLAGLAEGGSYEILFTPIDSEGNRGLWETRTVDIQTTDSDGDGVPDQWEITYGFDPNNSADLLANGDLDLDGVFDKDEFLNGSNPKLTDSDEDGISDKIEINLRSLGLDPAVANPGLASLVNDSLTDGFNLTDLRRLKPGAPILLRDPDTGKFVMTVDVKESPDLSSGFTPLPLTTENVSLTPAGNIEVEITPVPGDTKAFYRIEIDE